MGMSVLEISGNFHAIFMDEGTENRKEYTAAWLRTADISSSDIIKVDKVYWLYFF